ncbi:MAG: elongation factor Ts [Gemmatimonadetes bacterium]|jgi:elongation factor Ts|nr:elongation factor Ts [Gemmatimonadota bacterium]MBK9547735.1 elongation factor Ts [Gemmatimonadota bacterium]MBP6442482.1 elongation factor Ts [Gemmatimonadales bacterium]MBP6569768.1 elongation factor Ts [Gemmatimonadales bacterium]MBP9898401.1 elongation factor Ts [Gemmatimonadales bacterium]
MSSMTISTKDISELRARTGAGMMDCKKALEEANGDMALASELLRKKGIAKAEKRAGRDASQGLVVIDTAADGSVGAMVELNCETDFVARNEDFLALAKKLAAHALATSPVGVTLEGFLAESMDGTTIEEVVKLASGKTGEAVSVKRVAKFGGAVGEYRHFNGQVGVLVEVAGVTGDAALALAREVALHIASADPIAVSTTDIPVELLDRERRIAEEQVAAEGKPEAIRGKIVDGKVKKFAADRALLEQAFIKDESVTVGAMVARLAGASVVRFARFKVGEAV